MDRGSLGRLLAVVGAIVVMLGVFVVRPENTTDAVVDAVTLNATTITASATSTTLVAEQTAQDFLEDFFAALVANDAGTLYDTVHPVVIEQCGGDEIRSYLQTFDDATADFTVRDVSSLETYDFDPGDGTIVVVDDTYAVMIDRVIRGETVEQTIHLGVVENRLRWFTRCPS